MDVGGGYSGRAKSVVGKENVIQKSVVNKKEDTVSKQLFYRSKQWLYRTISDLAGSEGITVQAKVDVELSADLSPFEFCDERPTGISHGHIGNQGLH